jgi:predicted lysophospholipase L1 biosynthesis ABC-type transport system permease subunit
VRQGVSGLFRPGNQTGIMLISLGFGAFLLASLVVVSEGLGDWLSMELSEDTPALLMFDIQTDQREGVEALLSEAGVRTELIPIVPAPPRLRRRDGRRRASGRKERTRMGTPSDVPQHVAPGAAGRRTTDGGCLVG